MDASVVVCIRSRPGRPQQATPPPDAAESSTPTPTLASTSANGGSDGGSNGSATIGDVKNPHRQWPVSVTVNDHEPKNAVLTDPFTVAQYEHVFDRYLRDSDRPRWRLTLDEERDTTDNHALAENHIAVYTDKLWNQLDRILHLQTAGVTECQLLIVEEYPTTHTAEPGIHCLAWELLETTVPTPRPHIRVTRVSDFPSRPGSVFKVANPLSACKTDFGAASVRVLLVVARDFSRTGAERDPEPDLAQFPLMTVQKKLRSRMLLEVVRPGSREELEEHLRVRSSQGVTFHLVHFDLHGRIMRDEHQRMVPWLLFARKHKNGPDHSYGMPQTHHAKAEAVAHLLAHYKVENVVLNACLSAYNRNGPATNLAHVFLKHGIRNVSAMWYYVHWQTVATYLETFYNELLVKWSDFHVAAQRGREAIRKNPTNRTGREYRDFFLCVDYARDTHRTNSMARDPSPTPSAQSQDSSGSTSSAKNMWKPSTPRLGDNLTLPPEEPMRMKLHLLELEYKLTSFRVVYASDLRRADSKLGQTIDRMVSMWLTTNLVDEVYIYRGKDLGKRRIMSDNMPYREKRTRASGGGYLQLLFPRAVRPLRQTLHIVKDIDPIIDPGIQADDVQNKRSEERRRNAEANLERLAQRVHEAGDSFLLLVGSQDAQWWRTYLEHLNGEWWLHMPWSFTVHSRYNRDNSSRLLHDGARRSLTPSPLGLR